MKISTENPLTTFINGQLFGSQVIHTAKKLIELNGLFEDETAFNDMDGNQPAYEVDAFTRLQRELKGGCFSALRTYIQVRLGMNIL
jgi:hypothetical protein